MIQTNKDPVLLKRDTHYVTIFLDLAISRLGPHCQSLNYTFSAADLTMI